MRQDKRPRQSAAAVDRHSRMHNVGQVDLMTRVLLFALAGRDGADTSERCRIFYSGCVTSSEVVIGERTMFADFRENPVRLDSYTQSDQSICLSSDSFDMNIARVESAVRRIDYSATQ